MTFYFLENDEVSLKQILENISAHKPDPVLEGGLATSDFKYLS